MGRFSVAAALGRGRTGVFRTLNADLRKRNADVLPSHVIPAKAGIHLRRGFPGPLPSQG